MKKTIYTLVILFVFNVGFAQRSEYKAFAEKQFHDAIELFNLGEYEKAYDKLHGPISNYEIYNEKDLSEANYAEAYYCIAKYELESYKSDKTKIYRLYSAFLHIEKAIIFDNNNKNYILLGADIVNLYFAKTMQNDKDNPKNLIWFQRALDINKKAIKFDPNNENFIVAIKNYTDIVKQLEIKVKKQAKINEEANRKAQAERIKNNKIFKSKVEIGDHVTVTRPDIGWMSGRITSVTKNGFEMDVAKAGNLYGEVTKYDKNLRWIPWLGTNDADLEFGSK